MNSQKAPLDALLRKLSIWNIFLLVFMCIFLFFMLILSIFWGKNLFLFSIGAFINTIIIATNITQLKHGIHFNAQQRINKTITSSVVQHAVNMIFVFVITIIYSIKRFDWILFIILSLPILVFSIICMTLLIKIRKETLNIIPSACQTTSNPLVTQQDVSIVNQMQHTITLTPDIQQLAPIEQPRPTDDTIVIDAASLDMHTTYQSQTNSSYAEQITADELTTETPEVLEENKIEPKQIEEHQLPPKTPFQRPNIYPKVK